MYAYCSLASRTANPLTKNRQ